jgi:hypothetical protein
MLPGSVPLAAKMSPGWRLVMVIVTNAMVSGATASMMLASVSAIGAAAPPSVKLAL